MKIRILINPSRARRWHLLLAEKLASADHTVALAFAEGGRSLNPCIAMLMGFERFIYRKSHNNASGRVNFTQFDGLLNEMSQPDLIINLTNRTIKDTSLSLRLLFNGDTDEMSAVSAILHGEAPHICVVTEKGEIVFQGLPAIEPNQILSSAFNFVLIRCVTILAKAVVNIKTDQKKVCMGSSELPKLKHLKTRDILSFGASVFISKMKAKFYRTINRVEHENQDHWRIVWRKLDNENQLIANTGKWPKAEWSVLEDDNERFYADPFIFEHCGQTYLFVEEFPYASMKGVISVSTVSADGKISKPKHVLERPFHLSYPYVFERDGEIWMIPETYSSGKVELYRAERFPDKWVFEQVLVDDVVVSDATLFEKDGVLWLFAAEHDGGSSWDTLSLWYSKNLKGPWQPHKLNPVLVDARTARPGGKIISKNGRIIRPAQNCVNGYGTGLILKEITILDENNFAEHEIADLPPPVEWGMVGVHTLNSGAGIEVIDQLHDRARPS